MTMKIYKVGGAVRDSFLNRPVKDVDWVIVGATSDDIQSMMDKGYEQVGADFPVFLHPETNEEYALARTERKIGDGYHGFETTSDSSVTLEEDLIRRDLTINAMAMDPETGEVIDPFGGEKDLQNGILRHVSGAFAEDPLRVLRVARFAARYGFTVAPETMHMMRELVNRREMEHLVAERVWLETEKAISERTPMTFFSVLDQCGAKDILFPEMEQQSFFNSFNENTDEITKMMIVFSTIDWRLAETMMERFKASSYTMRMVRKFRLTKELIGEERQHSANEILCFFKFSIDAFRRSGEFSDVWKAIGHMKDFRMTQRMSKIIAAFRAAQSVTFNTLPEDVKREKKGAEIGKAIDEIRLTKIRL